MALAIGERNGSKAIGAPMPGGGMGPNPPSAMPSPMGGIGGCIIIGGGPKGEGGV